jgi:hypothetical protein
MIRLSDTANRMARACRDDGAASRVVGPSQHLRHQPIRRHHEAAPGLERGLVRG